MLTKNNQKINYQDLLRTGDAQVMNMSQMPYVNFDKVNLRSNSSNPVSNSANALLPKFTYDQMVDQILDGYWIFVGEARQSWDVAPGGTLKYDASALTAYGKVLADTAFQAWSMVSGINFVSVLSGADITLDDDEEGNWESSTLSNDKIVAAEINIDFHQLNPDAGLDDEMLGVYIHEIGHALGLGHSGNYNEVVTYDQFGTGGNHYLNDSYQFSAMSYISQEMNTYLHASAALYSTPMIADIIAIQKLYGVAGNLRTGNTTYGVSCNAGGYYDAIFRFNELARPVALTILDDGGVDTLNANYGTGAKQIIDLRPEGISDIAGLVGNIVIARGTILENAVGDMGVDTIYGNSAKNVLKGLEGADILYGGGDNDALIGGIGADRLYGDGGLDRADYSDSTAGLIVDLLSPTRNTGIAAGDQFYSVEGVVGSRFDDALRGDNGNNSLWGDTGNDILYGGKGNDTLIGGAGADHLEGEAGQDCVDYSDGKSGLTADLLKASINTGFATGDTYTSIENLAGSQYKDILRGDNANNTIWGGGGIDQILGRDGADLIYGERGNDKIMGGDGNDTLYGGASPDQFHFWAGDDRDKILDFQDKNDRLFMHGFKFADLTISQSGTDTMINYGQGDSIQLVGMKYALIHADDFVFV